MMRERDDSRKAFPDGRTRLRGDPSREVSPEGRRKESFLHTNYTIFVAQISDEAIRYRRAGRLLPPTIKKQNFADRRSGERIS